jgi:RND superfamily putative drug exporter
MSGSALRDLEDSRVFAALGRFAVRFRWLIIAGWIVVTVVLTISLPSLTSVEKNSNSNFLPANEPSVRAQALENQFDSATLANTTFVAATSGRQLNASDEAAIQRVEEAMRSVPLVTTVLDQGTSTNQRARRAFIEIRTPTSKVQDAENKVVVALRSTFASGHTPGLAMHLTGGVASSIDEQNQNSHIQALTEILSVLFILALLFLTFRALLAPFVALLPSAVALFAAEPLIAASTHIGVQVSDLTPILLIVVLLGAGTDYGLFLIFRLREELRRGKSVDDAVAFSVCKVGESITFSGLTVIGALVTVVVATFGFYKGLGPALAIGIAVALVANLTLLPALLSILGRSVFWPRIPKAGPPTKGAWGRIAAKVVGRPVLTLVIGLVVFGGLAASMIAYTANGFNDQPAPATSDSGRGQAVLAADFPSVQDNPTPVLFRLPQSVWSDPGVVAQANQDLVKTGDFAAVTGALDPNGVTVTPAALAQAHALLARDGPANSLPMNPPAGVVVSSAAYKAYLVSGQYISPDGKIILYDTALAAGPVDGTAAAAAEPAVSAAVDRIGHSIGAVQSGVSGDAALAADVGTLAKNDLFHIIPIVLIVLALVLAVVLRSLVAPLYLVASVGLSYLASLGLAVLIFEIIGGQDGINFVLPFFMFIFIMALGQDYNILVMTRIREEAHHAPIKEAVRRAVEATGTTVTSAGLILAGTFGVLTATGNVQVQEIGLGLAAGILLDTFLVRTLLVPSVVVLLGRWNWWPSKLSDEDHSHDPVTPDNAGPQDGCDGAETGVQPLVGAGARAGG